MFPSFPWIAADAFVGPGVTIGDGALLAARSSAFADLPAGQVCVGEPANDVRRFLRREPIRVGLSDGRFVLIRHRDQAVVSDRYLFVGLTTIGLSAPLVTPDSGDEIARDGFWVNLIQIVSVEPADAAA